MGRSSSKHSKPLHAREEETEEELPGGAEETEEEELPGPVEEAELLPGDSVHW